MNRAVPAVCAVLLALGLAWQLLGSSPPTGLARMPVFTPASLGISASSSLHCGDSIPKDAAAEALGHVPLEHLLDALAARGVGSMSAEARQELEVMAARHRELLELRNQRHAWNVESMELVTTLAGVLEDEQLEWVLSNRDRVARQTLDENTWRRLGLFP